MINVHTTLIREELASMGVDAFAILMCITTHINAKKAAWPGIDRLRKMTGLSKERTYKAIQKLIELGHIERKQDNVKGEWGKVVYRVTTQYLGVYMGASEFGLDASQEQEAEPLAGNPEHGYPEYGKPETGNTAHISISQNGSIEQKEVLTHTPREEKISTDWKQVARTMAEHARGEGKEDWQYMTAMYNYTGRPEEVVSEWACKATPYQLQTWRDHFPKLLPWVKRAAQSAHRQAARKPASEEMPAVGRIHRKSRAI